MPARDRHGRGPRGPVVPRGLPAARSRRDRVAAVAGAAVRRLAPRWRAALPGVEVEVVDVPPAGVAALAAHRAPRDGRAAVVVLYRRPVELRSPDHAALVDLVRDLVAEELAALLGTEPEDLDPDYGAT